ncbi:MAG: hypothetical protein GX072_11230 [Lysinibacillus sp.]|nr:hypothetical protein [Lysinibacillus sp.]
MIIGIVLIIFGIGLIPFGIQALKEELSISKDLSFGRKIIVVIVRFIDTLSFNNYTSWLFGLSLVLIIAGIASIILL